jgi:iron complex outermembrane recepter protein
MEKDFLARALRRLIPSLALLFLPLTALAQAVPPAPPAEDTTSTQELFELGPLVVIGSRTLWTATEAPLEREGLRRVLEQGGVQLIRRGVFLASDLYVDGFKRGEIEVVIDGERYPNACPNRMDPPITRVNPTEMEALVLDKASSSLQAGLGGKLSYQRSRPATDWSVRGGVTGSGGSSRGVEAMLALETRGNRITGQIVRGEPFETARGQAFADLYGYRQGSLGFNMTEFSGHGVTGPWEYGSFVSLTDDIPFPYLQMDERYNRVWGAYASYRGNKLYVNRTRHLMDNGLRTGAARMSMRSDATNLTAGLIGDAYEVFYRRWSIWNRFEPGAQASWSAFDQHMMPDVDQVSASIGHTVRLAGVDISGRLGLRRTRIDGARLAFFQALYPDAESARWFMPLALSASVYRILGPGLSAGVVGELASEPPVVEQLYVSVAKPMGRPFWSGNPTLRSSLKSGIRGVLTFRKLNVEGFAARVGGYVYLTGLSAAEQGYVSYENVDAFLAGVSVYGVWRHAEARIGYTHAQNLTAGTPLLDTVPLGAAATLRSPEWHRVSLYAKADAAAAQTRVDESLGERRTPAWVRLDAGAVLDLRPVQVTLDVLNLTGEVYYQHLSYMRDPFASGVPVYEPGRTVRLGLRFAY